MKYFSGIENYLCSLDNRDLPTVCEYTLSSDPLESLEFLIMAKRLMEENGIFLLPQTVEAALDLYVLLVTTIEQH